MDAACGCDSLLGGRSGSDKGAEPLQPPLAAARAANGHFCSSERAIGVPDVPIGATQASLAQLNERSREIFRQIVESYLATGEPVGSRNISRILPMSLSPASVRNVMSDLEQLGLDLCAAYLGGPVAH